MKKIINKHKGEGGKIYKKKEVPVKLPSKESSDSDSDSAVSQTDDNDSDGELELNNASDEGSLPPEDFDAESEQGSDTEVDASKHKKSLEKLKKTDPDFYDFLEQNDKNLLDFETDSNDGSEPDDDEKIDDDQVHTPGALHGDSDESDFEPEEGSKIDRRKITLKMISDWQEQLRSEGKIKRATITEVISAFNAAMLRVASDAEKKDGSVYKVEGSSVFNAVIQMCVLYLQPALKKYLGMEQSGKDPQKCKHFVKVKSPLIAYFNDLLKLLGGVSSANILTVLLKHLHQMSGFVACFIRIAKLSLKRLIVLWSTGEETVRVLAFLCIVRITRNQQAALLDRVMKAMYLVYVKNSKFVSPSTWPGINFMRRSLVEMFSLDLNVSYQHVFLYIRQLAIHLRNAIVVQKIESRQAVYNWQYVNSMHLWADLLGATCNKPQLQSLIYPLVMIITNTIKLVPTQQYYPLRFHCVEILIKLSKDSDTFIPVLPFILEVLTNYDFNKKNKKMSMKPLDFSCILRLSKSQLAENGFKDSVIDRVYSLLLAYSANESHSIAFPDTSILTIMQIKQFLKTCSVANYTKKMRQLLEKIEENARFIDNERKKISFSLSDTKLITAWETSTRNKGTPLSAFFNNWYKINRLQKRKKITKNDELVEDIPVLKKVKRSNQPAKKTEGPVELFPSDSEDEKVNLNLGSDEDEREKPKKKIKKKKVSKEHQNDEDHHIEDKEDLVEDFNVKDW